VTRLEKELTTTREPEDVAALKAAIEELATVSVADIERLYREWSEGSWCAGWIMLSEENIDSFRYWLLEEVAP
jgi:hypothetical protein